MPTTHLLLEAGVTTHQLDGVVIVVLLHPVDRLVQRRSTYRLWIEFGRLVFFTGGRGMAAAPGVAGAAAAAAPVAL